jgi:recombination protein RecR
MDTIERLTACLNRLPGVGRRSAERMAVKLARDRTGLLADLIRTLQDASKNVCCCSRCGSITSVNDEPCKLCTGHDRDESVLCVVEDPNDIMLIERSAAYRGRYHALMGRISPSRGEGPSSLRIDSLLERIEKEKFKEIILALSTDVEGDSTASYIIELLKDKQIKISRLASGLPAGSGIVYSDPLTLSRAIKWRTPQKP